MRAPESRPPPRERAIVALDVPSYGDLLALLDRLEGMPVFYKVGLELFLAEGARALDAVRKCGGRIFLDLKLHDIPETVARALAFLSALRVDFLTLHAAGGLQMMRRAAAQLASTAPDTRLLAVTVLTSLSDQDLAADGLAGGAGETALRRARLAARAGIGGLVCSPRETAGIRSALPEALLVVPGVRPASAPAGDQRRIATPTEAVAAGADYLVVGRPIRDAAEPAKAFAELIGEIEAADRAR